MPPHLVVSISGHGYGHVAQTAPVINALHRLCPHLKITIRSSVTDAHLRARIHVPFTLLQSHGDIGMIMTSPLEVDIEKSRAAYHNFHIDWKNRVAKEACLLKEIRADFVLSNVGYLPLAGARQAGIPSAALCSLNWADIYRHYCCDPSNSQVADETIAAQIQACYADADVFFRATPGMAMDDLANLQIVSPIASVGSNRRDILNRHLGLSKGEKLLLVSMGGISNRLPLDNWPEIKGLRYLVPAAWKTDHPSAISLESMPLNFNDLLASVDALLCKPGYGSFVESASTGVPVLYVDRAGWPESPALTYWLHQHGTCIRLSQDALSKGNFTGELAQLLDTPKSKAVLPTGASQIAAWLAEKLA